MMTRHSAFTAASFLSVCSVFSVASVLSVASAAAQTTLIVQSEAGDPVGGGSLQSWTPATASFTVSRNALNGISARVDAGSALWTLDLSLPNGRQITPGHYTGAMRYPQTPFVGMAVSRSGIGCAAVTGRYLVREAAYGVGGEVLQLAVDVEQHCENAAPALFVALRYNSLVPNDVFPDDTARYAISMTASAGGLVTGGGLACGGGETACSTTFSSPTNVTLVATPSAGHLFNGWSGGCAGGATTTVAVNTVKECSAAFTPAVPTFPRTRLAFAISGGAEEVHTFANSRWVLSNASNGNDLTFQVQGLGAASPVDWQLELRAPAGGLLQSGSYPNAVRASLRSATPGLEFSSGTVCATLSGAFTVHQYVRNPATGEIIAFAADFAQQCPGSPAASVTGRIEYWATHLIPSACQTPDPFAALGGGTCFEGGWLPPGMPVPTAGTPAPAAPQPPPPPAAPSACSTPDPFATLGGGSCYEGGWLPPGMPVPAAAVPSPLPSAPPAVPTPPPPGTCSTTDPFAALGGGTCYNGGWLPPGMPIPGGG